MRAILGHEAQIAAFLTELGGGRLHHAWLLAGPEGIGKASLAFAMAKRALVEAAKVNVPDTGLNVPPDHPVGRLVDGYSHPDLVLLERLPKDAKQVRDLGRQDWPDDLERARSITVDQIRALGSVFALKPSYSSRRIVIVDSIDDLERGGANALLKSLEEPPSGTIFLLVSHAPGRLLPTIRSRCRMLRFEALPDDVMMAVLREKSPQIGESERKALVEVGQGSVGRALHYAGLDVAGLDAALAKLAATGDPTSQQRHELAKALALKSAQPRFEAFLTRAPAFVASEARTRSGESLAAAIRIWEQVRSLSETALRQSLDPSMTVFTLAGMVAGLAGQGSSAKA